MPENPIINDEQNTITYNVVLDPGDIARQAEEIRNQLDLALGVGSNAGTQFINTADVINPQFATLPQPDFTGIQGQFSGTFDQSFWERAQGQITGAYQDVSSGLDRMQQDLSMMVNRASNFVQNFQPSAQGAPYNPYEDMLPDSFGEYLLASVGFGGDIKGPIAPSVYQRYGRERLSEGIQDVFQNPGEAISDVTESWAGAGPLGLASYIGAHFIPGYGQALTAIETVGLADEWLSGAYNKREDLAGGIQEIARQQFGTISKEEARGLSQNVLDFVNSYQGYAQEYDIGEVSANILQFANEGGFSNTRNVEQMQQWIQTVTEETRQIARNLGVFQDEAVSIMAELAQKSMVSSENMRDISEQMRFYGGVLKQDPVQLLQGAVNTAEQFRQAGMYTSPETAMQTYIDANVEAQRLIQSNDPFVQSSIYRMGGPQGVAQGLLGLYGSFQNSTMGNLINMNQGFGGTGGNINNVMTGLGQNMQSIDDLAWWQGVGQEETLKNQSLRGSKYNFVENLISTYTALRGGPPPSWDHLIGFSQTQGIKEYMGNLSLDQVRLAVNDVKNEVQMVEAGRDPDAMLKAGQVYNAMRTAQENTETTFWGDVSTVALKPVEDFWRNVSYEYGNAKERIIEGTGAFFDQGWEELGLGGANRWLQGLFTTPEFTIDDLGNTKGYFTEGGRVVFDFKDDYTRKQVGMGRYSIAGEYIDKSMKTDLEQDAMKYLNLVHKKGITNVKDIYNADNQKLLKEANLDEKGIENRMNIIWGDDTYMTEAEKFAIDIWEEDEINNPRAEGYYKSQVENLLKDNPELLKDENGEFLPFDQLISKIDALTLDSSPYANLPEQQRKRLQAQSLSRVENKELQEKVITKDEAKQLGQKTLDRIKEGDIKREELFKEAQNNLNNDINEQKNVLSNFIKKEVEDAGVDRDSSTIIQMTANSALNTIQSFKGSPEEKEKEFARVFGEYYKENAKGHNVMSVEDATNLVKNATFDGISADAMKSFTESSTQLQIMRPLKQVYDVVKKEMANIEDAGDLGMSAFDISKALYQIIPGMASTGQLDLSKFDADAIKEFANLMKNIRTTSDADLTEQAKRIAEMMPGANVDDVKKNLQNMQGNAPITDDKDVPENTKKIKDNTELTYRALTYLLAGKDIDDFYKGRSSGWRE